MVHLVTLGVELVGVLLITLLSGIGSISGISGGAITVPFSLLFFQFRAKEATAFSNVLSMFVALIKTLSNISRKDPLKRTKTLIGIF